MDSNIAAPSAVSLVIAGGASIDPILFGDLMDDWLRYGTKLAVDAAIWLPATPEGYSSVVDAARHWSVMDDGPGYGVVVSAETDASADRKTRVALRAMKADKEAITYTVKAEELGASVAATLITLLVEDNAAVPPRVPFVILSWGPENEAPDEFTAELRMEAEKAGIPVLEIAANGLQEMGPMEPETAVEETVDEGVQLPLPGMPDEAQATVAPSAPGAVWGLSETLQRCLAWFSMTEAAQNAINGATGDPMPGSMLVQSLRHHCYDASEKDMFEAAMGSATAPVVAAPDPEPEPVVTRKGKSRTPADKVAVYLSPAAVKDIAAGIQPGIGEIKLTGRGRSCPAGWVREQLSPELIPGSLLAA